LREVHIDQAVGLAHAAAALAQVDRHVGCKQTARIQTDGLSLPVDFVEVRLEFGVQSRTSAGKGSRCRLHGQCLQPVEDLRNVAHSAVHNLQLGRGVVAVAHALRQFRDGIAVSVGDCQAGRIVAGLIDAVAGSELFDCFALENIVDAQILLSDEGVYVRLYGEHSGNPFSFVYRHLAGH